MKNETDIYSGLSATHTIPEIRVLRLASAGLAAQAIYVFVSLGIADALRDAPRTAVELAEVSDSNCAMLYRVLRFLATVNLIDELDNQRFRLTRLGRRLCMGAPATIRDSALLLNSPFYWKAIGQLLYQVKTGNNGFEREFGMRFFDYLSKNPVAERDFSAAMDSSAEWGTREILAMYDFSGCKHVVDIGGGKGAMLHGILRENPAVCGTLYDSDAVLGGTPISPSFEGRLNLIAGDFFKSVPRGADTYVLRRILHDWDDEHAIRILRNCAASMAVDARLLVIELSPEKSLNTWAGLDLLMMVLQNGKERTELEIREILAAASLKVSTVYRGSSACWIFEAMH